VFQLSFIEELDPGSNSSKPIGMEFVTADILRMSVGDRASKTSLPSGQSAQSTQPAQADLFSQDWSTPPTEQDDREAVSGSPQASQAGIDAEGRGETISVDDGLSGLVDNSPLFDFSGYLERHEHYVDALTRIGNLDLPAGDGATVTDTNGITVPLSFLLEHLEDGFGQNDATLPAGDTGSPDGQASIVGMMDSGESPFDFKGYLEISEQCIVTLGQADGLGALAASATDAAPEDSYAVQLALLLEEVNQHPGAADIASLVDHHPGEIPSAAEITGLDWLSPEVVDTYGFDYSLF